MSVKLNLGDTDENFFGTLDSKSNLANIFGIGELPSNSTDSLQSNPIRSAKVAVENSAEECPTWEVEAAKVVSAFKLINSENVSQGRVGLAVLKNAQNKYKLILYRSKSNILATRNLCTVCKLTFKASYLQFHDELDVFWSIFLKSDDEKEIMNYIPSNFVTLINDSGHSSNLDLETQEEPPTDKSSLVSRMAKMGQPLLKLPSPAIVNDASDSSDAEVINVPDKPSPLPRKVSKQMVSVRDQLAPKSVITYTQTNENQYLNMLLADNRTQNTEVRMNLVKLDTKLEKVLDKIEELTGRRANAAKSTSSTDDEIFKLEENILQLRKENRQLRQRNIKLENSKLNKEKAGPSIDADVFRGFDAFLLQIGVPLDDYESINDLTVDVLRKSRLQIETLQNECKKKEQMLADNNVELLKLASEVEAVRVTALSAEELQTKLVSFKQGLSETLGSSIKEVMNNLYSNIVTQIEALGEPISKQEVLRICGHAIRNETMNVIKEKTL